MAHLTRLAWALLVFFHFILPAHADGGVVDQVEFLEMGAGETEFETQLILIREEGENELIAAATLEHALSDRLQFGIEVEGERETGDALQVEAISLQLKWRALGPDKGAIGLGIQPSLNLDPSSGRIGSETFLIAEAASDTVVAAANLIVATAPGEWDAVTMSYAVRAGREFGSSLSVGVESGGGLKGEGAGSHFAGAVVSAKPADRLPSIELAVFAPLSAAAPGWQVRLETDWEF